MAQFTKLQLELPMWAMVRGLDFVLRAQGSQGGD